MSQPLHLATTDRSRGGTGEAPDLTLVLPALDEEEGIVAAVTEADRVLQGLVRSHEIIVVDDGSRDRTAELVRREARSCPRLRLVSHGANRGYGGALRSGFAAARAPWIAFTDADRQFHLEDLERLFALSGSHEVVCGYRVERDDPWLRRMYSALYNILVRGLLRVPVRDCDCALKLFRADALESVSFDSDGFLVNAELLTRLRLEGWRIVETGVRHRRRRDGVSKVSPLHAVPVSIALLRFWWSSLLLPSRRARPAAQPLSLEPSRVPVPRDG